MSLRKYNSNTMPLSNTHPFSNLPNYTNNVLGFFNLLFLSGLQSRVTHVMSLQPPLIWDSLPALSVIHDVDIFKGPGQWFSRMCYNMNS